MSALGLNTAFGDAYNLAWKLALVLSGKAPDALIDSYESERQPVGARVADWALNGFRMRGLIDQAIGVTPGQVEANRQAFERLYSDTPGGATARAILAEAMHVQRIGPQAHDMEIGYRYEKGALVPDGTAAPARDPMAGIYHPITRPGARLPHAVLERDGVRIGAHDLVRPGGFTLFCSHAEWRNAAAEAAAKAGLRIELVVIDARAEYRDVEGTWARLRQVDASGAVLVRPDAHVAWRSQDMPASPADTLVDTLSRALCF